MLMALIAWGDRWATPEGGPRCWSGTAILSQVIGGRARQPEPGSTVIGVRGVQRPRGSTPEDGFDNLR